MLRKPPRPSAPSEDVKALVIARLLAMPGNRAISIGAEGSFTPKDLVEHVENGDALGRKIIDMQMKYLQALSRGELYDQ